MLYILFPCFRIHCYFSLIDHKSNEHASWICSRALLWLDKFLIGCLWLYLCAQNSMLHALIFEKAHLVMTIKTYFCYSTSIKTEVHKEVDNSWGHLCLEYSLTPYSIRSTKILFIYFFIHPEKWIGAIKNSSGVGTPN